MKAMKSQLSKNKFRGILPLFLVILISVLGIVFIYSASNYVAEKDYGNKFYFVRKQLVGLVIGIGFMIFCLKFDYQILKRGGIWYYVFSMVLLALVFVPIFSVEVYGAKRWIRLVFFTIQPSEIAKFCYIIFVAGYFGKDPDRARSLKSIILPVLLGVLMCLMIILEPNMSITMCVAMLMIGLLFAVGVKKRFMLMLIVPVILAVPLLIIIEPYRLNRLSAFLNPWSSPKGEGYQLIQSLYALGSGGWFGVGLFNSRQKFKFLPFAESDFILSVIGEELGFLGVCVLFLAFALLIVFGFITAKNTKSVFSFVLVVGITLIYAIQVFINALVVTGSIPPTGLPLPLISSGNTSLVMYLGAFGLMINIYRKER